jgi:hypothetical protein
MHYKKIMTEQDVYNLHCHRPVTSCGIMWYMYEVWEYLCIEQGLKHEKQ